MKHNMFTLSYQRMFDKWKYVFFLDYLYIQ